jgi:hypothetical protein
VTVFVAGRGGIIQSRRPIDAGTFERANGQAAHQSPARCSCCQEIRAARFFPVHGDICTRCRQRARKREQRRAREGREQAIAEARRTWQGSTALPRGPFVLLYRCWGEDGALLYVGITGQGMRRVLAHAGKGWFEREVAAVTFQRTPAKHAAEVEREVIRAERPRYNLVHARDRDR